MRHAVNNGCSQTRPRSSLVMAGLSFIGSLGIVLAVIAAVAFTAAFAVKLAWKGW